jgi:hypothetical protein
MMPGSRYARVIFAVLAVIIIIGLVVTTVAYPGAT